MILNNKTFQILYSLFKPHRKLLAIYLAVLILYSILEVFRVSLIYPIINYGLDVNTSSTVIDTFFQAILPQNLNPFVASAFLLAIATLVIAGVQIGVAYLGSKTFSIVRDHTDRSVFEVIKSQPFEYFVRHKQGDLLYIGQQAVNQAGGIINTFILFLQSMLLCLFYFIFILLISFELSIVVVLSGLVYVLLIKNHLYPRIYRHGKTLNNAAIDKSVIYNEFISGIKTILITDSVQFWAKKYDNTVRKLLNSYTRVQVLNKLPGIISQLLMFMLISIGAIGLYYLTGGHFLPYVGIFGTFMFALYRLIPSLNSCQTQFASITQSLPALESVYNTLQEGEMGKSKQTVINKKSFVFNNLISFQNVFFKYNFSLDNVISSLSFDIKKNTKVAIVGNSGAGKTTIANLLAFLYQPTAGEILIDGINLNEFNPSEYLKTLGYLGQETFVYHDTIKENIKFGLDCTNEEIIEAAKLADAHEFIMATPEGYDTIIGDQGMKLSGGQRQRVAIARVILRKPEILLLDEATSSLDNISEKRVMESVDRISENMTVIIIAHRLSTVQNADVIFVLKDGKVYESGTHEELLEKEGEYFNLYLNQNRN